MATEKQNTRDAAFATEDSSALAESRSAKKRGDLSVLAEGAKRNRWSDLVEEEEEDEYEGMPVINFNDLGGESSNEEREWEDEVDDYAHWNSFSIDPSRREDPYPAVGLLPDVRLSALAGVDSTWTIVGKINPKPLKLTPKGIYDIFYHLLNVHMVPSARKAVAGDGVCI